MRKGSAWVNYLLVLLALAACSVSPVEGNGVRKPLEGLRDRQSEITGSVGYYACVDGNGDGKCGGKADFPLPGVGVVFVVVDENGEPRIWVKETDEEGYLRLTPEEIKRMFGKPVTPDPRWSPEIETAGGHYSFERTGVGGGNGQDAISFYGLYR